MVANAKCAICGRSYVKCVSCSDEKKLKPWKVVTDTIEHYKVYLAIHGYTVTKNKEIAMDELLACDLSELELFNPEVKSAINEIMDEPKKMKPIASNKLKKQSDLEKTESELTKNDYE